MQQGVENDQSQGNLKDITIPEQTEQLDSEQCNRLWEHGLHAENIFFNQTHELRNEMKESRQMRSLCQSRRGPLVSATRSEHFFSSRR